MSTVAGVVILTAPGAGPRVAARLTEEPGLDLAGGDGDARLAAVWEGQDGRSLEALAEELLSRDPDIIGVYPTFVGSDEEP